MFNKSKKGFSIVEVLLASSIFALLATAFIGAYLYGEESTALAGARARAAMLSEEGLEAARHIRDQDFAGLADGTYGIATSSGMWVFSGSSDTIGVFTRVLQVGSIDSDTKLVTSTISWQQNAQRVGSVVSSSYFTDWAKISEQSASFIVATSSAAIAGGGDKELQGITIENIGTVDIIISKITVTWDNSKLIEEIKIDNDRVWKHNNEGSPSGKQVSGTEIDIEDFTLSVGSGVLDIDKFKFDGDMEDTIFTILFTLGDGSTKQVTVDLSGGVSCGTQTDSLTIDSSGASIGGGGDKELQGLKVENSSRVCDITIAKITSTWTSGQQIEEIKIEGDRIWKHNDEGSPDGKQLTGVEIDVVDYTLSPGDNDEFDKFKFDGDMTADNFNITFEMSDGSTKAVNIDFSGGGGSCGTETNTFVIDISGASISGGGDKEIQGLKVENTDTGSCDITIAKITTTWTNGKKIQEIKIEGNRIWKHNDEGSPSGKQDTGTEIDVVDYVLGSGENNQFDKFKFDGDMDGNTFNITFELGDGSTKSTGSFSP